MLPATGMPPFPFPTPAHDRPPTRKDHPEPMGIPPEPIQLEGRPAHPYVAQVRSGKALPGIASYAMGSAMPTGICTNTTDLAS